MLIRLKYTFLIQKNSFEDCIWLYWTIKTVSARSRFYVFYLLFSLFTCYRRKLTYQYQTKPKIGERIAIISFIDINSQYSYYSIFLRHFQTISCSQILNIDKYSTKRCFYMFFESRQVIFYQLTKKIAQVLAMARYDAIHSKNLRGSSIFWFFINVLENCKIASVDDFTTFTCHNFRNTMFHWKKTNSPAIANEDVRCANKLFQTSLFFLFFVFVFVF